MKYITQNKLKCDLQNPYSLRHIPTNTIIFILDLHTQKNELQCSETQRLILFFFRCVTRLLFPEKHAQIIAKFS